MDTYNYIYIPVLGILGIAFVFVFVISIIAKMHQGKIADKNKNFIPDPVEKAAEEIKKRSARVKEEVDDVAEDIINAVKGVDDIPKAAKGAKRRGRPKKKLD